MFRCNNSGETKYHSSYDKSICFIETTFCNVFSAAAPIFKQSHFLKIQKKLHGYQDKNTVTKNNKMQLIITNIIRSYYALSNKNIG